MRNPLVLAPLLLLASVSHASCGSSFCTVNTSWDTQGLRNDGGLLVDLRYAYARADEWLAGSSPRRTETPGGGSGEEIENKRTIKQILNLNVDYALNRNWAVMLGVPYVMRDHQHTLDSTPPVVQQASFSELGDVRVQAKYRLAVGDDSGAGIRFGLKLPTGTTKQTMTPATPFKLERSSQPGSGSTDGIVGLYYFRNAPGNDFGWFVSGQYQAALATRQGYRPGDEVTLDTGVHYAIAGGINLLLQINAELRRRDGGGNAEAASGGYSVSLAPGASYGLADGTLVYGFVQLPVVRYVNTDPAESASGQLAARWAASIGITRRF